VEISVTVCFLFVCLYVCTVTDFSGEDKASGVKCCTVVHGRPGQGIFHFFSPHFGELCSPKSPKSDFGELCSPKSPKSDESATHPKVKLTVGKDSVIACLSILCSVWT